jgi:ATP-binding protein involved in chromosome partitioning
VVLKVDGLARDGAEAMRAQAEKVLRAAVRARGGSEAAVRVVATGHSQATGSAAPAGARRHDGAPGRAAAPMRVDGVTHLIAVASGKGGVGKSTVTVNLAHALLSLGLEVGILDADIYGPSLPTMLGLVGHRPLIDENKRVIPPMAHGLKAMSIGFFVPQDTATIWRGPMVQGALQQLLRDTNWAPLDVLLIDMPPGTGDAQLTMAQQVALSGAVIVSTPQDIALIDARKGMNMFEKVSIPVLGLMENMSYFNCPKCGERSEIFGHGGARAEAARLGLPLLGEFPLDLAVRLAADQGKISTTQADAFSQAATLMMSRLEQASGSAPKPPHIIWHD